MELFTSRAEAVAFDLNRHVISISLRTLQVHELFRNEASFNLHGVSVNVTCG